MLARCVELEAAAAEQRSGQSATGLLQCSEVSRRRCVEENTGTKGGQGQSRPSSALRPLWPQLLCKDRTKVLDPSGIHGIELPFEPAALMGHTSAVPR